MLCFNLSGSSWPSLHCIPGMVGFYLLQRGAQQGGCNPGSCCSEAGGLLPLLLLFALSPHWNLPAQAPAGWGLPTVLCCNQYLQIWPLPLSSAERHVPNSHLSLINHPAQHLNQRSLVNMQRINDEANVWIDGRMDG